MFLRMKKFPVIAPLFVTQFVAVAGSLAWIMIVAIARPKNSSAMKMNVPIAHKVPQLLPVLPIGITLSPLCFSRSSICCDESAVLWLSAATFFRFCSFSISVWLFLLICSSVDLVVAVLSICFTGWWSYQGFASLLARDEEEKFMELFL